MPRLLLVVLVIVAAMTAMHEMHERTRQQQKVGNGERHMREVIDEQVDAEPSSDEAGDKPRS
jgi:hypothetical protein